MLVLRGLKFSWKAAVAWAWVDLQQRCSDSFIFGTGEARRHPLEAWLYLSLHKQFVLSKNTYCPRVYLFVCLTLSPPFPLLGCFHWIWRKCDQTTSKRQRRMVHHWFCRAFGRTGRIISIFIRFITTLGKFLRVIQFDTICLQLLITA